MQLTKIFSHCYIVMECKCLNRFVTKPILSVLYRMFMIYNGAH